MISSRDAPSAADRALLVSRRDELRRGCRSGDAGDIATVILAMFDAWPNMRMDAEKSRAVAMTYGEFVERLPLWAVEAGARACKGRNTPFPPSSGEFRAACEAAMADVRVEMTALMRILSVEVYEPNSKQDRDAIRKGIGALLDDIHDANGFKPLRRLADYRDNSTEAAQQRLMVIDYDGPVVISGSLARYIAEVKREYGGHVDGE